jgi:hypothetical protein
VKTLDGEITNFDFPFCGGSLADESVERGTPRCELGPRPLGALISAMPLRTSPVAAMGFVVKITGEAGNVTWLAFPDQRGFRTLGTRQMAELFENVEDAQSAIAEMQRMFFVTGLVFSVETAA